MGLWIKHRLNPLHVYCRLLDLGIGKGTAARVCRYLDMVLLPLLYGGRRRLGRTT